VNKVWKGGFLLLNHKFIKDEVPCLVTFPPGYLFSLHNKLNEWFFLNWKFFQTAFCRCHEEKPVFAWLESRASVAGVPILEVTFPGSNQVDYIHFRQFNPIPLQSHERVEDVDPCIFEGHLENEPDVYAVLTSGCPFEDSFQVNFSVLKYTIGKQKLNLCLSSFDI